jgi:hypothetical protein
LWYALLARTSDWVAAICRLDADAVLEGFDDSDVFQAAEHGLVLTRATIGGFVSRRSRNTRSIGRNGASSPSRRTPRR